MDKGWKTKAQQRKKTHKKFLKTVDQKEAVGRLTEYHDAAFEQIDCLDCAACCKNYSPRFKPPDIKRVSKYLRMKPGEFIETYLKLDDEGDYVVKTTPCPFLNLDNTCSVYDKRPSDCARFPYTNEDVFLEKINISIKNISFCPAAFTVIEEMMKDFK